MEISPDTVCAIQSRWGRGSQMLLRHHISGVKCEQVQLDELWSYVRSKKERVAPEICLPEADVDHSGLFYVFLAVDPVTRLIVACRAARRRAKEATMFAHELRGRLSLEQRLTIITDGWDGYFEAIPKVFSEKEVDFWMMMKGDHKLPHGYYMIFGEPTLQKLAPWVARHLSTNPIEGENNKIRSKIASFNRRTTKACQTLDSLNHAIAIYAAHHNFCTVVQGDSVTPAMLAGLTHYHWSLSDLHRNLTRADSRDRCFAAIAKENPQPMGLERDGEINNTILVKLTKKHLYVPNQPAARIRTYAREVQKVRKQLIVQFKPREQSRQKQRKMRPIIETTVARERLLLRLKLLRKLIHFHGGYIPCRRKRRTKAVQPQRRLPNREGRAKIALTRPPKQAKTPRRADGKKSMRRWKQRRAGHARRAICQLPHLPRAIMEIALTTDQPYFNRKWMAEQLTRRGIVWTNRALRRAFEDTLRAPGTRFLRDVFPHEPGHSGRGRRDQSMYYQPYQAKKLRKMR